MSRSSLILYMLRGPRNIISIMRSDFCSVRIEVTAKRRQIRRRRRSLLASHAHLSRIVLPFGVVYMLARNYYVPTTNNHKNDLKPHLYIYIYAGKNWCIRKKSRTRSSPACNYRAKNRRGVAQKKIIIKERTG